MRAFHCSWWSFFVAFFVWFAIAPLQSEIQESLDLTDEQLWQSAIFGFGGTIFVRFLLGPACDKYGARILFSIVLCSASIPTAMTGLVNSATGLSVLRLFIGVAGGSFVMCQYWTSTMFTDDVVGTANALAAGWGNLGGGVTQLLMGALLFPAFKIIFNDDAEMAWRTVCVVPAVVAFITGIVIYRISDDAPKGNYSELKRLGVKQDASVVVSCYQGTTKLNTWILFVQYACCFGVELVMNNAAALYFKQVFGQTTESAAAIASIFGWMNLFARGLGGFVSDYCNVHWEMQGRIAIHALLLLGEGALVLVFANTNTLGAAIVTMVFFSIFVQASEGTSYAIVPYIDPPNTGSVSGIVGAGGNVGAVAFGLVFRQLDYRDAFIVMGFTIIGSSLLSGIIFIPGYSSLFCAANPWRLGGEANRQQEQLEPKSSEIQINPA